MTLLVAQPPVAGTDRRWTLTPLFMLRIAGLPVDTVAPLRQPEAVRWAEELLTVERELDETGGRIADLLQDAVRHNVDDRDRRLLLDLRRDVFNRRLPRDLPAARRLAGQLPAPTGTLVHAWLDRRIDYAGRLAAGDDLLAREVEAGRAHLRGLATDPRLRHGLLLSSPSLDRYLPTYLDAPPGRPNKRARRIERSVLEYVYRTACKTSPFSTLTGVALGRFAPGGGSVFPRAVVDGPWRGHTRLNIATLAQLSTVLADDPRLRPDLPVRLTSGLHSDRERVRYVRRLFSPGDDTPMGFGSVQENLFYLSQGAVMQEIIDILGEEPELPYRLLAERLCAADPADRDPAEVDLYLRHLLRLSLLTVPASRVDIHSDDPLRSFAAGLARLDRPWSVALAGRLDGIAGLVGRYPAADLATRRGLLSEIRETLEMAHSELGVAELGTPQTLVYEDVSVPQAAVADADAWRGSILPSLQQVARLLPVFDLVVSQKLSLKGFFVARFGRGGRCDDVLRFVHEFHRDYYEQYLKLTANRQSFDENGRYQPQPNWLRVPEVDGLTAARVELIRRMALLRAGTGPQTDEVVLDDEFVEAVAGLVPGSLLDFEPRSFFVQLADDGERPLAVINRSYSGLTLMFSRFVHCFDDAGPDGLAGELRRELARLQPEGAVFAELTGGYDTTNLNLHPGVTAYELVCPGDVSFRTEAEQLPVDDLTVVHDEESDQLELRSRALGVRVIPVYLGFLVPLALPEVQRTMLLFSPTSMARLDLWSGTDEPADGSRVRYRPRLRYRDVVLDRRTWTVHPDELPERRTYDGDAEWFLGWQRWRARHGLPRRVFATLDRTPLDPKVEPGEGLTMKPQYVDFDSTFSLNLLENTVRTGNRLVSLQEMLPDVDQVWLRSAQGGHVTEQTVEITGTTVRTAVVEGRSS